MRRPSLWSLRSHLLLLVLLAVLPALLIVLDSGLVRRREALRASELGAAAMANQVARRQEDRAVDLRHSLAVLAETAEVLRRDGPGCERLFRKILAADPGFILLLAITPEGRVFASSTASAASNDVADRKFFQDAVHTKRFSVGGYAICRYTHRPVLNFSYPVCDPGGTVQVVLVASLDLGTLDSAQELQALPAGASISILDHQGTVLYGTPGLGLARGTPFPMHRLMAGSELKAGQVHRIRNAQGETTLGATSRSFLPGAQHPYLITQVEIPEAGVVEKAQRKFMWDLGLLVLAACLAMGIAWMMGGRFFLSPIRHLVDRAERLGRGDQSQPSLPIHPGTELGRLAQAFNEMSAALKGQHEALRASEEHYRLVYNEAPMGIFHFDVEGAIQECNQAFAGILGIQRNEVKAFSQVEDRLNPSFRQAISESLNGHIGRIPEVFVSVPGGRQAICSLITYPITSVDGHPLGGIGLTEDITERYHAEGALRQNQRYIRTLFNSVNDAIFVHNLETGAILDVNAKMLEMYGCSRAEALNASITEFSQGAPPFSEPEALAWMRKAAEGVPQVFEWHARKKSGELFWAEVNMRRAQIEGEDRLLVTVRDIEGRRSAEAALRESQERYLGLFNNSPDSIFWIGVGEDGTFVVESLNPAQERLLGVSGPTITGQPLEAWLPKELADQVQENYRRCVASGAPLSYEETADLGSGLRSFHTLLVPIRNAHGRIARIVGISSDITERRQSEAASRERETLFRLLFERSGDANLLIDGTLFVDCNQSTVDILGAKDRHSVLNMHPSELSPEFQPDGRSSREKADEMIAMAFSQGSHRFEWVHKKLDGTEFPVEVTLTAIPWKGKKILHTTWRDRTEQKQAEALRRTLEIQFLQAQKLESLGILAGGIAHDFNNLLTAIMGNLNLAGLNLDPASTALPFLDSAEKAVRRASELTNQMLAYSGKGRFVVKLHDVNEVVQDLAQLLQVSISKKAILRLQLSEHLPPIEADGAQFQQLIMNLVTNASDALDDQEGTIRIATGMEDLDGQHLTSLYPREPLAPGRYVTLEVTDTGSGMSPEVIHRIFDPFFTTKVSGRGLGLSAILGILRGHKAALRIESEVGKGSTFKIYFPATPGRAASESKEPLSAPARFYGTVLLVDDEKTILDTTCAALQFLGFEVITARDGQEALDALHGHLSTIDLVIMDLTMPRMDGLEAFQAMRAVRPELRIILSSGYNEHESIQPFLGKGLAGFLQKPYTLDNLRRTIQKILPS